MKRGMGLLFLFLCGVTVCSAATVRPQITREALINPGMGWVNFHFSNRLWAYGSQTNGVREIGDTLDWFPGCSVIYFRVPWALLEPEENHFRWDLIDSWAQPWIQAGKKIAIRVTCCENRWVYATPKWVRDAGAKGVDYVWPERFASVQGGEKLWEPDYLDPVFLQKLDHFLGAMSAHYRNRERIAFLDIGTIGVWGEGHTDRTSKLTREQTDAAVKVHVDLHKKHFPDVQLVISDDVGGWNTPGKNQPSMRYAFQHGVTLRDDSIMVNCPPKSWYHAELASLFWPTMPVVVEHEHYGLSAGRGAWSEALLEESVEAYHASYLSIHWFAKEYLEKNRGSVDRINLRLGYRLEPREIVYPDRVRMDQPFTVSVRWANVGVASCYAGGYPTFTFLDEHGRVVWLWTDESFSVRELPASAKGKAQEVVRDSKISFGYVSEIPERNDGVISELRKRGQWPFGKNAPMVRSGVYTLCLSVGDADGTPRIALPLARDDGHRRYPIGRIVVE